ncbi:hypothetical protein [Streptomyces sp. ISL-11]|uniref:hypothetical protein n=1 Tax=Streptomyces sp. ISL-11 TaxID=2819174 RepID=UPI001BE5270F|nr:hypothetical protein [Streptomyces sp. ISL-11]MBT2383964.1 hypothetical protein [Streptomyces sp. ISL-11]
MRGTRISPELFLGLPLGAAALLAAVCAPAQAAGGPKDVPDYQGALTVLHSAPVKDKVCRFLTMMAKSGGKTGEQKAPVKAGPCDPKQTFSTQDPIALNEITPDFVAGKAKPDLLEAVRLTYLVSLVTSADGKQATVMLVLPGGGGEWRLAAVRDGDGDFTFAGRATPAITVFAEPQIRAWYRVTLDSVAPLNDAATAGLGGKDKVSLAEYQKLVTARYADKLPGSEYDTKGLSSGYRPTAAARDSESPAPLVLGGSGAALTLAGGAFALRAYRGRTRPRS